jgi:hypothetical protein
MSELDEMNCDEMADLAAELALGVLTGRERAKAIAHLDRCDACRENVRQLTETGQGLLGLLPSSEPRAGFETRVMARLEAAGQRPARPAAGPPRPKPARLKLTRRMLTTAAVVLAAAAAGLGGWGLRGATSSPGAAANPRTVDSLYSAPLTTASHVTAGTAYLYDGSPRWMYMSVKIGSVNGMVLCQLVEQNGRIITVGSFRLNDGFGYWASPDHVDPDNVKSARLTTTNGTVLATASFLTTAS